VRFILVALLVVLWSSCSAKKAAGPEAMFTQGRTGKVTTAARAPAKGKESVKPTVTPDEGLFGKVILVNPVLRFVVMDFPVLKRPAMDQRLNVYHQGQKVGEVKVTGPMLETTAAGDIATGEAHVGDEVRED